MKAEKSKLRKDFKKKRSALSSFEVQEKSQKICQNFIKNLLPKIYQKNSDKIFSLYLAANNEADPRAICEYFVKNLVNFSYPKIIETNSPLEFILSSTASDFVANKIYSKILEPKNGETVFPDFIILPLLAFDPDLSRLGMGGGFFDRTISKLKIIKPNLITIGLAYDFQRLVRTLPTENTDQKLDFIATESRIFLRS
jgi:5-formyltetrahydrofolate cyclo-ligase